MHLDDVKIAIRGFILEEFAQHHRLKDDELLFEAGIIDSLGMVKLTAFIEETFGIVINPSEATMDNFDTIEKIAEIVNEKTKKNV